MSSGTCTGKSLWRVSAHEEGLVVGGLDRYLIPSSILSITSLTIPFLPSLSRIVSAMAHSLTVPSSAKIRLCPSAKTTDFGRLLEHAGASWVTLHARHVSAKRRRQGAADLDAIRELKQALTIPVVSNGNVRTFSDVQQNASYTCADGVMVGETLLGNPWCVAFRRENAHLTDVVDVAYFRARQFGIPFSWPWTISRRASVSRA